MAKLIKGKQIKEQSIIINSSLGHVIAAGNLDMSNYEVLTSKLPTTDNSLANKAYVDAVAQGVIPHAPVSVVSTTDIATLSGLLTIDDVTLVAGNRILVAGQTDATENGIWVVASGAWTRATDADGSPTYEVSKGDFVFVENGTVNGSSGWVLAQSTSTDSPIEVGVETQVWFKMAAPGSYLTDGEGIEINGNIFSIELDGDTITKSAAGLKISDTVMARISVNEVNITSVSSEVSQAISTLSSVDVSLETRIQDEEATSSTAVSSLEEILQNVSAAISEEADTRSSVDVSLENRIQSTETDISTIESVNQSITDVLSTALTSLEANDNSLETRIQTEETTRSAEISTLTDFDTTLSSAISSEEVTRSTADASLETRISSDISTATNSLATADTSLETRISTEELTRSTADASLETRISTSESAVTSLDTRVTTKFTELDIYDTNLSTSISNEETTRSTAVTSLEELINNLSTTETHNETYLPSNSGSTANVVVTPNAFVHLSGDIDTNSISVHLNGLQYSFGLTNAYVFYTNGIPTSTTGTTLYFNGGLAGFALELDDEINIKFTVNL